MEIIGDPEGLLREVMETARRESAAILAAAEEQAAGILAAAQADSRRERLELLDSALATAAGRRDALLASVPAEAARFRAERREALLENLKSEVLAALPAAAARRGKAGVLAALAAEAVGRMEGKKFLVSVAAEDRAEIPGLPAEIGRLAGRGPLEISVEAGPVPDGGVLVRDAAGRQYWDNSFRTRLERAWPGLRRRVLGEEK